MKRVNKLLGLEIDEVSLVDRPANQHGLVTITKRDETPVDEIFDAEGNLIDPSTLQAGDYFYDDEGNEFRALTQEQADLLEEEGLDIPDDLSELDELIGSDDRELTSVGKAGGAAAITGGASSAFQAGRKLATRTLEDAKGGFFHARSGVAPSRNPENEHVARAGAHVGRNAARYGAGGAGAAGFGAGHHRGRRTATAKSLGQEVLTELSKAYTDGDRDQVVAKALEQAESRTATAELLARRAVSKAQALEDQREYEAYVELAKGYELPVDPEDLGAILQTIAKSGLTPEQLDTVDRVFTAAGETRIYDEYGSAGLSPSSALERVQAQALEIVGKADLSLEQATTALFEADDAAYLEYLAETGH